MTDTRTRTRGHRILLVDDHPIVREGMAALLGSAVDLEVCSEAGSFDEAVERFEAERPDLVILDLALPGRGGLELLTKLKRVDPAVLLLVVSMHTEAVYAERALAAGAAGYISKAEATDQLVEGIRRVLAGDVFVSRRVAEELIGRLVGVKRRSASRVAEVLSPREFEIFQLLGQGMKTRDIASNIHVSVKTVETHMGNMKLKLGFQDGNELRYHAVHWSASSGHEDPEEIG